MSAANVFSRNERAYIMGDVDGSSNPTFITTAQATPVNGNYVCMVRTQLSGANDLLRNPCKTGTLSKLAGIKGRHTAGWSMELPVQGSGAAGTAPDGEALLAAMFGAKATVSAGVSRTFALADNIGSMSIYDFWQPSTASHLAVFGAIVRQMRLASTPNLSTFSFSGPAVGYIDSNDFAGLTTAEKGGLGSFPTEPSTPVSNGTPVAGFLGAITINSITTFGIESFDLTFDTGASIDHVYGNYIATLASQSERTVTLNFRIRDEISDTDMNALKTAIRAKTAFTVIIQQGTTAGNIWTWTIRGLQFSGANYDDSANRRGLVVSGGIATASSAVAKNELGLVLT